MYNRYSRLLNQKNYISSLTNSGNSRLLLLPLQRKPPKKMNCCLCAVSNIYLLHAFPPNPRSKLTNTNVDSLQILICFPVFLSKHVRNILSLNIKPSDNTLFEDLNVSGNASLITKTNYFCASWHSLNSLFHEKPRLRSSFRNAPKSPLR